MILDNVPLNVRKSFVMAKTKSGCEVYMPVDSDNDGVLGRKKVELQAFLDTQPDPPALPTPSRPRIA